MAGSLGKEGRVPRRYPAGRPEEVRARDAAVSVGRDAHGPRPRVLDHRRARPLCAQARIRRFASFRLGCLRASCRECRHQGGCPPGGAHSAQHRFLQGGRDLTGHLGGLVDRDHHLRSRVLPLEPVVLPPHARARHRLPAPRQGELLSARQYRPRQRAGRRGPLLAVRDAGDRARDSRVGVSHHRLRGQAAGGPQPHRLAGARRRDAAELDRTVGRPGDRFRRQRGPQEGVPGLHHPRRHHLRRNVRGGGARSRARDRAGPGIEESRAGGVRGEDPARHQGTWRRRAGRGEGRDRHRHPGEKPVHREGDPGVGRELRPLRIRHGGSDGGAGARPARP